MLLYVIIINASGSISDLCTQSFPTAGIAYNLILIRVAKNRANPEPELPTFIGDSTIERAIPAVPRRQPETVAS
jgi:hypothetical protein